MRLSLAASAAMIALGAVLIGAPAASAAGKKKDPLVVCKQGCEYRSIQDAVDDSGRNAVIEVEPGKYKEGVIVQGKKHNGLTIMGTKKNPKKTILEGKGATNENGIAQHGIEGIGVKKLRIMNMWARNYATNGFFVHSTNEQDADCRDYVMKNLRASFNRAYGLYAFDCIGGKMVKSVGYGHGDSAFYVGATPEQSNPKWTQLRDLEGYKNVVGWTGTNSRYIRISGGDFYNNGIGLVPNTLDSEPYEPSTSGIIENNNIFWNNFNYFAPGSPVQTISDGLGEIDGQTINFPTAVGIVNLGVTDWVIRNNEIFGHFRWGVAAVSNPFNEGDQAKELNNQFVDNRMGRGGTDINTVDFFSLGSGKGDCFGGNVSSTFDSADEVPDSTLYPPCPAPDAGTGTSTGYDSQFGELAGYVTATPSEKQECQWTKREHPPFEKFKPFEVPGVTCP